MGKHDRRIGFIPDPQFKKDVPAILQTVMYMFNEGTINNVCLITGYVCPEILVEAGFPSDNITVIPCGKKDDPIKALMVYLKTLPKELIFVRIIARSYLCPRLNAQLNREEAAERKRDCEHSPTLLIGTTEVFPKWTDLLYPIHLLKEGVCIAKDILSSKQ